MPVYVMPVGHKKVTWRELDAFTQGYIEAMFFTENGGDNDIPEDAGFSDLAPEALETIKKECAEFQKENAGAIEEACEIDGDVTYDETRAGQDFWYTRNRHGVGFWDRGIGATGDKLTDAAHKCGEMNLYLGDDGKLYV